MKFTEGLMLGSLITAGAMIIYSDGIDESKRKILKKGRSFLRKIGM